MHEKRREIDCAATAAGGSPSSCSPSSLSEIVHIAVSLSQEPRWEEEEATSVAVVENHEPTAIIIVSGVIVPCRRILPPLLLNHRHYEEQSTQIGERIGSLVGAPSLPNHCRRCGLCCRASIAGIHCCCVVVSRVIKNLPPELLVATVIRGSCRLIGSDSHCYFVSRGEFIWFCFNLPLYSITNFVLFPLNINSTLNSNLCQKSVDAVILDAAADIA
ncbi:hypothetical protein AHAS_Ahas04G0047000 [Arachis hypogaea]